MDLFVDLKVPAVDGSQWTAAERQREEKSLCGNDLQTLLDFCGSPQNDAVERVKGIEPSYAAWEAAVLPLNYTRKRARAYRSAPELASFVVTESVVLAQKGGCEFVEVFSLYLRQFIA